MPIIRISLFMDGHELEKKKMNVLLNILQGAWEVLLESSVYVIFGLMVSGLLKNFISPNTIAHHLGHGRFVSVIKAALLGIPIPL